MTSTQPSNRRAARGTRVVRAAVVIGLAASAGLMLAGAPSADSMVAVHQAPATCESPAIVPVVAL